MNVELIMKENAVRRANDLSDGKIIQATLEAVKTYSVHAVTRGKSPLSLRCRLAR